MANAWYEHGLTAFAEGDVQWKSGGDTFKVILIDTADYSKDLANDEYLSSIPGPARVAIATMTVSPVVAGVLDASDVTFTAVSGDECEALVIYQHTGTESTSRLLLYIDSGTAGLPVTPTGGADINITWSNGSEKIAKL